MKKVTLYYVPNAPASEQAKELLEQKEIAYQLVDVRQPDNARKLAKETKQWNAPVLVVGQEAVVGYDEKLYDQLLERR
jgi:arsenate reductase-like glutaredoxin family protein